MERTKILHTLEPVFDGDSRVLLLGTMPSPKSRESGFYYGHPQNRFWQVLSGLLEQTLPVTREEKLRFLRRSRIALWDVLACCEIAGASDASIRNPVANDIAGLLADSRIHTVFTTGRKAEMLYQKYCFPQTKIAAIPLPSTSPANARMDLATLIEAYRPVRLALAVNADKCDKHETSDV